MVAPVYQASSRMAEQQGGEKESFQERKITRLLLLLPRVSMRPLLELAFLKEVHSPTRVDDEDDDPEDDDGDSPIFKLKVSISLVVMGRCVQLN